MIFKELKKFIQFLKNVKKRPQQTFDLGLIVKESQSKVNKEKIWDEIKKVVSIERLIYDEFSSEEDVIGKIIDAFKNGKWVWLEIKKDIGSLLLNQLKNLTNNNFLQLIDYQGKDIFEIKMPQNSRLIIFAEKDFIENKISYPHFYRLFGPTLRIK